MAASEMTQAFGLTHWKAAASRKLIGRAPASAVFMERAVAIFQASQRR
jgi:hypothetical protein